MVLKTNNTLLEKINVHHIEVDNRFFLIDSNTGFFCEESELTKEILEMLPCSLEEIYDELSGQYPVEEITAEIDVIKKAVEDKFLGTSGDLAQPEPNIEEKDWYDSKILQNLWINISNDCNMQCIYCFEHGGNYGKEKCLMTIDTLKNSIDFWYKYLDKDAKNVYIIFFGGEPLFNKQGIKFAVEYINKILAAHEIKPHYNVTTNATLLDEEFAEFIVENKIPVTISIDGGKDIQNKNRPLAGGHASFELVQKNIKEFLKIKKVLTARVTLVHEDVEKLADIVTDLWDMGFCQVQYDLVSTDNENLRITEEDLTSISRQVEVLAELSYKNIVNNQWKVLRNLTKIMDCINFPQRNLTGCSFYTPYTIMVDPAGEIFKCQRLMEKEFCAGTIYEGLNWKKFYSHKLINNECGRCWASTICNDGCPQVKLANTGNINTNSSLWCEHTKILINEALKLYAKLYMYNPEIFEELREVH